MKSPAFVLQVWPYRALTWQSRTVGSPRAIHAGNHERSILRPSGLTPISAARSLHRVSFHNEARAELSSNSVCGGLSCTRQPGGCAVSSLSACCLPAFQPSPRMKSPSFGATPRSSSSPSSLSIATATPSPTSLRKTSSSKIRDAAAISHSSAMRAAKTRRVRRRSPRVCLPIAPRGRLVRHATSPPSWSTRSTPARTIRFG